MEVLKDNTVLAILGKERDSLSDISVWKYVRKDSARSYVTIKNVVKEYFDRHV